MDMHKILNPDDISRGVERRVISLENPDSLKDVADFVYVRYNVPGPDTDRQPFSEQYAGCDCGGICDETCPCIQRFGCSYDDNHRYNLTDPLSSQMKPVLECNKDCKCVSTCNNRVVQLGIQYDLQLFRTKSKGFGVKTLCAIPRNSFVCEYAGEILTYEDANVRARALKSTDCNYILVVNEHIGQGNVTTTYVDPTYIGNVGRFLNHSCEPNLYMIPVRVNNSIPKFALFALRDIEPQEELCYDYSGVIKISNQVTAQPGVIKPTVESSNKLKKQSNHSRRITQVEQKTLGYTPQKVCHCGSKLCKGYLPFDATLFKETSNC